MGPRHRGHSPVLASSGCTRVWRERTPTGDLDPGSWSGNRRILVPASTLAADTQVSNWPVSTPPGLGGAGLRGHPSPGANKTDIPDTGAETIKEAASWLAASAAMHTEEVLMVRPRLWTSLGGIPHPGTWLHGQRFCQKGPDFGPLPLMATKQV